MDMDTFVRFMTVGLVLWAIVVVFKKQGITMDNFIKDNFMKFIAVGLVLWAGVNVLMKFMPNTATQLPLPVYEFFYSITVNTEPSLPTKSFPPEPNDVSP